MSSFVATVLSSRRAAFAAGLGLLASACSLGSRTLGGDAPSVSAAGASYASVPTTLIEEATLSLALDRIDQQELPLDRTYRHFGTGRGITVYVFDGGVMDTHPELAGRVRRGFDAFPGEERLCNAHGTAVAGAAAGTTLGVAPEAEIVDVKMVECRRMRGTIDAIVRGTRWVLADHAKHPNSRAIANWSFIADTAARIPALDSAVAALRAAGIPVIVSAGNVDVNACRISPGNADGTIVVGASALIRDERGASDPIDRRAPGTAWGPCVDIYAPGDSVLLPSLDRDRSPTVQLWNGTSMSAGYVSGAAALFLETNPTATPDDVAQYLRESSTKNVVYDSRSPFSRMLFVGPREAPSLADARRGSSGQ